MITPDELKPEMVGALVEYQAEGSGAPEYGLLQGYARTSPPKEGGVPTATVYVRFHLGDTAASCNPDDLTLVVNVLTESERSRVCQKRASRCRFGPIPSLLDRRTDDLDEGVAIAFPSISEV